MHLPPLTRRQKEVLSAFAQYQRDNGLAPTLEELGQKFGVNRVTIYGHIQALLQKGFLENLVPGASRGLDLTPDAQDFIHQRENQEGSAESAEIDFPQAETSSQWAYSIPLVGKIAAGGPIEAIEQNEGQSLQELLQPTESAFLLEVQGDSMIEAHIQSGDLVMVQRDRPPSPGDIVVAVLRHEGREEATLKYYRPQDDNRVLLQPANPKFAPILANRQELSIRGVVCSVIRRYR